MRSRFVLPACLSLFLASLPAAPAFAEDCGKGSADERIACLTRTIEALDTRVGDLNRKLDAKADVKDTIKYYDRIALMNEDMRIYPRCLDNPGPNSRDISVVMVTSCAKTPAQTWMVTKPYRDTPGVPKAKAQ